MTSYLHRTVPKEFFDVPHFTPAKTSEETAVPNNVFQCWMRRRFRKSMYTVWQTNVSNNPQFNFYVFNDTECRAFLVQHYDARIVAAYDRLKPGAYKSDLWRLCVLHTLGGIYLDMKFRILRPLKDLKGCTYVRELHEMVPGIPAIYQAVLVAKPGEPLLARGIAKLVENVEARYYGSNDLDPTGPVMMGRVMEPTDISNIRLHIRLRNNDLIVSVEDEDGPWFQQYPQYRLDQSRDMVLYATGVYYRIAWKDRDIYNA
jgi:hypothetical protein